MKKKREVNDITATKNSNTDLSESRVSASKVPQLKH